MSNPDGPQFTDPWAAPAGPRPNFCPMCAEPFGTGPDCSKCGYRPALSTAGGSGRLGDQDTDALASAAAGAAGLMGGGLVGSIIAVVTGRRALERNPDSRYARAGLTMGWVGIAVGVVGLIFVAIVALSICSAASERGTDVGPFGVGPGSGQPAFPTGDVAPTTPGS